MRSSDVRVGAQYAYRRSSSAAAVLVRVLAEPARGLALVQAVDASTGQPVTGAGQEQVPVSRLAVWSEAGGSTRMGTSAAPTRLVPALVAAAGRALPAQYEPYPRALPQYTGPRLTGAYEQALGEAAADRPQHELVAALFAGLPDLAVEGLVAATAVTELRARSAAEQSAPVGMGGGEPAAEGTVGAVFAGAARLLAAAYQQEADGAPGVRPRVALTVREAQFCAAVLATVPEPGDAWTAPFAPALPRWVAETRFGSGLDILGWLRLVYARTAGTHLHRPGCPRTNEQSPARAPSMPLWQLLVIDRGSWCGHCHGPTLRHPVQVAQLVAAAAVWEARGRGHIEAWQRNVLARLVAASMLDRWAQDEADVPVAARVVDALAADPPGEAGRWALWVTVACPDRPVAEAELDRLDERQREVGRQVALARLNAAAAALPEPVRLAALPGDAGRDQLGERYRALVQLLAAPDLDADVHLDVDRLLFELPRALPR